MKALVVHPRFSVYGGGEYVCLNVIQALGEMGYDVSLASSDFDSSKVERAFNLEHAIDVQETRLPGFHQRFSRAMALQRTLWARAARKALSEINGHDLVFHTQTSYLLGEHPGKVFNVFFDPSDMMIIERQVYTPTGGFFKKPYYRVLRELAGGFNRMRNACNIPLSKQLEDQLARYGFPHTPYLSAPCDMRFSPREKERYVFQMTRMVPQKRLEDFAKIASMLPKERFVLLGSVSEKERELGYAKKIQSILPKNVTYIEGRIWDSPELLEKAAVYLYCSYEPGINISTAQAARAGCIPVVPHIGGGYEIVQAMDRGYVYHNLDQAVSYVREALMLPRWTSEELSDRSQIFSAENFREKIKQIVQNAS